MFWDYIPESKLCFCDNLSRLPGPYWIRPIQKLLNCQTRTRCRCYSIHIPIGEQQKTALWLWVHKITWYLYTRGVRRVTPDEWRQNNADLKLLANCVMNGFIIFGIMFMTATGLENSPQSFGVYTVSQSRFVVTSVENPVPVNWRTPQWARGQFTRTLLYQTGSKNGVI